MTDKYKLYKDTLINDLTSKINLYTNRFWLPPENIIYTKIHTNSWYSTDVYQKHNNYPLLDHKIKTTNNTTFYHCKKVNLLLSDYQKRIMLRWMDACILMYNVTIRYIRQREYNKLDPIYNWEELRTYHLKDTRNIIQKNSSLPKTKDDTKIPKTKNTKIPKTKDTKIRKHILDEAIKAACASYKSAISNMENKNIKHFRIRYIKLSKKSKTISLEPTFFSTESSTICSSVFGEIIETSTICDSILDKTETFDLRDIRNKYKTTCKINYNCKTNKFTLFIPIKEKIQNNNNHKEYIGLDPGIRTFLTGISENEVIKIGENLKYQLTSNLLRTDLLISKKNEYKVRIQTKNATRKHTKIRKKNITNITVRNIEKRIIKVREKIKNKVDDMHWKAIKYLTNKYKNIVIGNMSTKKIINNKTSVLAPMTKRIASTMRLFKFTERLKYKCSTKSIGYEKMNEGYTSKICTNCGNIKEDLGGAEIYKCEKCKIIIERDVNAARNILLKAMK